MRIKHDIKFFSDSLKKERPNNDQDDFNNIVSNLNFNK